MATSHTKRTHILLPKDLAREIDAIAGRRGRSAFLVETAREAVRRKKLLTFLESDAGWKESEHPELQRGAAHWVRQVRKESETRPVKNRSNRSGKARGKRSGAKD
jgi:metal-responsive CopG/Arc/MetJ family transcriptional regulator